MRHQAWFAFLAACMLLAAGVCGAESLAEQSLAKLAGTPEACAEAVDFIVCADPQPGGMLGTPQVFLDMIQEWNALKPDFVVCAGDMIMGGPPSEVGPMWDEFLGNVAALDAPFFPVAGNHDTMNTDPEVLRVYEERVGPFNYAVRRGTVECVVLNTEEPGDPDGFSAAQREWLKTTLAASTARHLFLFLHAPLFMGNWDRDWAHIAEMIKPYPMRAVFAGHLHYYRHWGERDGVQYVVSGSAGGGVRTPEEEGGLFCYLAVKVRGGEVSWTVVKPYATLPADTVTEAGVLRARELKGMLSTEEVTVPLGEPFGGEVVMTLKNPFAVPAGGVFRWDVPAGWTVDPPEMTLTAAPGETARATARVRSEGTARFPVPALKGEVDNPETGKPLALAREINLVPTLRAPKAQGPVTLDGDLSEWGDAPAAPLTYGVSFDPADTEDLRASTRVLWDDGHLYLAVEAEDNEFFQPFAGDTVWMNDSVEFWVEESNWSFSLTPKGPQVFSHERPDKSVDSVTTAVPLAVKRDGRRTVYEAAFPAAELPWLALKAGGAAGFSLLVNDLDPSGPLEKRHWAELTPGAGEHFTGPKVRILFEGGK